MATTFGKFNDEVPGAIYAHGAKPIVWWDSYDSRAILQFEGLPLGKFILTLDELKQVRVAIDEALTARAGVREHVLHITADG